MIPNLARVGDGIGYGAASACGYSILSRCPYSEGVQFGAPVGEIHGNILAGLVLQSLLLSDCFLLQKPFDTVALDGAVQWPDYGG